MSTSILETFYPRAYRLTLGLAFVAITAAACSNGSDSTSPTTSTPTGPSFKSSPCSVTGTLQLAVAQTAQVDCSNGGTTVTVAGDGASYIVVAQFAASLVNDTYVSYRLSSGTAVSASIARPSPRLSASLAGAPAAGRVLPAMRPNAKQLAFTRALRARARAKLASGAWAKGLRRAPGPSASLSVARAADVAAVPAVGSLRNFRVLADTSGTTFKTAAARLMYAGSNVLVYVDTLAPANGFTSTQIQAFGTLFDQTLYPIDTAAFGGPSDIDNNGRVIVLMTPAVNALTSPSDCQTQGFVVGFFEEEDLSGGPSDPNSNNGEIFYSIVPDPSSTFSCAHTVDDVGANTPATFVHELQHLVSYSQHVVIHNGDPEYGWLDEGMSILAEELGSLYYEQKCPGTACRSDPSQLFPDSSQGFVQGFLYDSYQYVLLPDTASVTLHSDADDGFSWRGGDWLLVRWLADHNGTGVLKKLDQSTLTGVANIEAATGQSFPALFANFGVALFADSLPGLSRSTAPSVDRFTTRNLRQLWNRLYVTSPGAPDIPYANPLIVTSITADTSLAVMDPGTMSFFRLDTPSGAATVSLQFSGAGGTALPAAARPQLAIFRLPAGQ